MKIELQEPFKALWKFGYLRVSNEGRQILDLYNSDSNRTTISYARYLMGIKLGYPVPDGYEVDHKDNDKTNDDIDNLQLLTSEQNLLKEQYRYITQQQNIFGYECMRCGNAFLLTEREVKMKLAKSLTYAFCSRSCSASFHHENGNLNLIKQIPEEDQQRIKSLRSQGLSVYKIADLTGYARSTIMKYWN